LYLFNKYKKYSGGNDIIDKVKAKIIQIYS